MSKIHLIEPCLAVAEELLEFEKVNRHFFESNVNARLPDYYSISGMVSAIKVALNEAREDKAYQFLIRDEANCLVGRVNLTRVRRSNFFSAEVGYRIAESACRRGYATEAVRQVLDVAFAEKSLARVEAVARPENTGSISVLLRNGFVEFGRSSRSFKLAGVWHDRLYFERHAEA